MGSDHFRSESERLEREERPGVDRAARRSTHPHHDPVSAAGLQTEGLPGGGHHPVVHRRYHWLQRVQECKIPRCVFEYLGT